jgi:hypothetical protein
VELEGRLFVPDNGSIVMFRNVGYMKCAADKAVRPRKVLTATGTVTSCSADGVTLFRFSPHPTRTGVGEREKEKKEEKEEGGTED